MVTAVFKVQSDTKIEAAIQLMRKYGIGCLPVVDERMLIGIGTRKDIAEHCYDIST